MPFIVGTGQSQTYEDFISSLPSVSPSELPNHNTAPYVLPSWVLDRGRLSGAQIEVERRKQAETNAIRQATDRIAQTVGNIDFSNIKIVLPDWVTEKLKEIPVTVTPPVNIVQPPVVIRPPVSIWPPPLCC